MLSALGKLIGSATSRQAAKAALPGAAVNFAVGTVTQGPVAGAAYAAGDFLMNYPLVGLARKIAPGTPAMKALVEDPKTGKMVSKDLPHQPSGLEQGVNLGASLLSMPLVDMATQGALYSQAQTVQPTNVSQEQQIYQQNIQRQQINGLNAQALARGTQYQMQGLPQGFHYPGVTLPPETLALLNDL